MKTLTLSQNSLTLIQEYKELKFGKTKVVCPYFINTRKRKAELRALIGKGTPEEIVEETYIYSKIKGFDINNSDSEKIREFMLKMGIGVDCSGFVSYILEEELKYRNKKPLINQLKFPSNSFKLKLLRFIRPIQNISADDLTSQLNTNIVNNLYDVLPGDLIRAHAENGGMHVAIVTSVNKNDNNETVEFNYVNSTRWYDDKNGIREGKVIIKNPTNHLAEQDIQDEYNGRNWIKEELNINKEDSGVRRPRYI